MSTGEHGGSGFFVVIAGRAVCITAYHVIDSALARDGAGRIRQISNVVLRTPWGDEVPAFVWKSSRDYDIAMLVPYRVPPHVRPLELDSRLPSIGSFAFVWSAPYGEALVPLDGLVENVQRGARMFPGTKRVGDMIHVRISVGPGSSEGPLLTASGKVIGVITNRGETWEGTGTGDSFAIAVRSFWQTTQKFEPPPDFSAHRQQQ